MTIMKGNGAAFRALLWKELHEALKWGAASVIVVAVGVTWLVRTFMNGPLPGDGTSIMSIYPVSALLAPLVALAIGMAQIIPENRGDKWGFLVHRAMPRSTLFRAKVMVGLFFYCVAFGGPMGAAIAWTAIPGHVATPFDARMILPAVADLCCGVAFYFAALVIGMRDARWYGSRILAAGGAVMCWQQVTSSGGSFLFAVTWCAIAVAVTAAAAWGTFVDGGRSQPRSRAARAAVGLSVAAGLAVAGAFTVLLASAVLSSRANPDGKYTGYAVTSDGQIVQTVRSAIDFDMAEVNDLQGHPLPQYADPASRQDRRMSAGVISTEVPIDTNRRRDPIGSYRETDAIFQQLSPDDPSVSTLVGWYYIHRERLIAGYDKRTGRLVGWLGPAGFTDGKTLPAARFPGPLEVLSDEFDETQGPLGIMMRINAWRSSVLSFEGVVYRLDLNRRQIDTLFVPPSGDRVLGANVVTADAEMAAPALLGPRARFEVVATTRQLYLIPMSGGPTVTVVYDPSVAGYGRVRVLRALLARGTPTFLRYTPSGGALPDSLAGKMSEQITEIGESGAVLGHFTLPLDAVGLQPTRGALVASALTTPPAALAGQRIARRIVHRFPSIGFALFSVFGYTPFAMDTRYPRGTAPGVGWGLAILTSLVSAVFMYALARRHAFPLGRTWLWAALGFGLGLLGVLLMLALVEWPARETCPVCGRKRVVSRDECEHCGGAFPPPQPDGTEIFESMVSIPLR